MKGMKSTFLCVTRNNRRHTGEAGSISVRNHRVTPTLLA